MEVTELLNWLTDGISPEEAAVIKKAVERDAVKTKVSGIKAQSEYQAIVDKQTQMLAELDGADGQSGTRAYKDWYSKNYKAIEANDKAIRDYDAKHGAGSFAKLAAGEPVIPPNGNPQYLSKADAERLITEQFQSTFAPNVADVLKKTGTLVQKHMYAKRTTPIDFEAIDKLMGEKKIGLEAAYDIWDAPEREKATKEATEKEIDRRVAEKVQQARVNANFPGGADMSQSSLAVRPKAEVDKFDRTTLTRDLAKTWITGDVDGGIQ